MNQDHMSGSDTAAAVAPTAVIVAALKDSVNFIVMFSLIFVFIS